MSEKPCEYASAAIFVLEEDTYCYYFLTEILGIEASRITAAQYGTRVSELLQEHEFDILVVSLKAQDSADLTLVRLLTEMRPELPVIAVAENHDAEYAIEVLHAGAFDYVAKPFNNLARVEKSLRAALLKRRNARQVTDFSQEGLKKYGLISTNEKFNQLGKIISMIAPLDITALITGESGTGKELIARSIHAQSNRRPQAFIALNCGAFPEGLVESLLFGHQKGAFTGAVVEHAGFVEQAEGGTLFLDEVGELSCRSQAALLRFIQERVFTKVGGNRELAADVRIIASTNRNLEEEVRQKRFREDLFYRLNVVNIKVPPLRERPDDILYLADYFMKRFCLRSNRPLRKLSSQACRLLERYSWPGNVRELENFIEGLLATMPVTQDTIRAKDLENYSERIKAAGFEDGGDGIGDLSSLQYKEALAKLEKMYLNSLLRKSQGNVAMAARAAGIHPITFHRKLQKLGIKK